MLQQITRVAISVIKSVANYPAESLGVGYFISRMARVMKAARGRSGGSNSVGPDRNTVDGDVEAS